MKLIELTESHKKGKDDKPTLRNPVAKFSGDFNKAQTFRDRTKYQRKEKHKKVRTEDCSPYAEPTPEQIVKANSMGFINELYGAAQEVMHDTNGRDEKAQKVIEFIEDGRFLEAVCVNMNF